jgi:aminoglycoside phosphotransferase (APT) family kinase protein
VSDNAAFQSALELALSQAIGAQAHVSALRQIPGGASHELWRFELEASSYTGPQQIVLQRPLGGRIFAGALDLVSEFRVLQAAYAAGLPVPRPLWLIENLLDRPAALAEFLAGEAIGRKVVRESALAEARAQLPAQLGATLAAVQAIDLDRSGLRAVLPSPAPGNTPARQEIAQIEADLDAIDEAHPAIELCLRWLRRYEPAPPDRLVLVHGDFRIGNVLVTSGGLNGLLDWEFAHIGDPAEDLAWCLIREWRFGVDQLHFGGIGPTEPFFAAYAAATGSTVDQERVAYWEVMHNVRWAIGTLNQARRHLGGAEPNLEFASLGRRCAEMELEALRLIQR